MTSSEFSGSSSHSTISTKGVSLSFLNALMSPFSLINNFVFIYGWAFIVLSTAAFNLFMSIFLLNFNRYGMLYIVVPGLAAHSTNIPF